MKNTKENIVLAAIKEVSEKGYAGATMDDIAVKAGVAKGTLYYHFKNKEEMFNYIVKEGMNLIKKDVDNATKHEKNTVSKIKILCFMQLKIIDDNKDFFKIIMSQLWGEESRKLQLRKVVGEYIDYIEKYFIEAEENNVIKKGDTYLMAYAFFGMISSISIHQIQKGKKINSIEDVNDVIDYILNGIGI